MNEWRTTAVLSDGDFMVQHVASQSDAFWAYHPKPWTAWPDEVWEAAWERLHQKLEKIDEQDLKNGEVVP